MKKEKKRLHYAWVILGCCICLAFGCSGIVMSSGGNFVTPVVTELDIPVSAFTMFISFEAAVMAFLYPFATKILTTRNIGKVLAASAGIQFFSVALMSLYRHVYFFYLSGVLIGIGASVTGFMALPIIINMWFHKNAGIALSIGSSFGRISSIVMSIVTGFLIAGIGWRLSYLVMAVMGTVITIPVMLIFVKRPEEVGCLPYGEGQPQKNAEPVVAAEWGPTLKEAVKTPAFYVMWLTSMIFSATLGLGGYMANFTTMQLGLPIQTGAVAASVFGVGCVCCNLALGYLNDRFGARAGLTWGCSFSSLGCVFLLLAINNSSLLIPACLILGLGSGLYHVQTPLLVRRVLGGKHYTSIWPIIMMGNSLVGAFTYSSIGLFFDYQNSYKNAFIACLALMPLALTLGCLSVSLGKKLYQNQKA